MPAGGAGLTAAVWYDLSPPSEIVDLFASTATFNFVFTDFFALDCRVMVAFPFLTAVKTPLADTFTTFFREDLKVSF